jgi:hypothetical protein
VSNLNDKILDVAKWMIAKKKMLISYAEWLQTQWIW